jgi:subtilisin family serine protease
MLAVLLAAAGMPVDGKPAGESSMILREKGPDGTRLQKLDEPGGVYSAIHATGSDGRTVTRIVSDAPERVIIQLRGTPLARIVAGARSSARQALAAQHTQLEAELARICSQTRQRALASHEVVTREFFTVFNGFAARLSRDEQSQLRRLPDVVEIYLDVEMRATLDVSVPLVGAPAFWSAYSFTGAGTVVAIIDTGVDYTHSDLGGCLGAACKVLGGFDFVDDDSDPMDENGHGTHVASTAAGSGTLAGVAPDASILAYRVLDAGGFGDSSDIIAGIERAVDPDDDGDTSDHADVINLSLGGTGDPDDPTAQAVDAATAAGVVVVAAAGNGYGFLTIHSPGAARTAVTVGATDDSDLLAVFSSRGPSAGIFAIKPEISAPGVDICAAQAAGTALGPGCVDSTHIEIFGTSMATPHVAGAAALLRGVFPSLSPGDIKSLLVNNSEPLGLGIMESGAGRLDVVAAAEALTVVAPQTLSFGLDDLSQADWSASEVVTARNLDGVARSYNTTVTGLQPGIQLEATPSGFTLGPGASTDVTFALTVDNALVPNLSLPPFTYEGFVEIQSLGQVQRLPWAFVKVPLLRLHFDEIPLVVIAHEPTWGGFVASSGYFPPAATIELLLPEGTYNVMALFSDLEFDDQLVVREGIAVSTQTDEFINTTEAVHTVSFIAHDENDLPLSKVAGSHLLLTHRVSERYVVLGQIFPSPTSMFPRTVQVSPLSDQYALELAARAGTGSSAYIVTLGVADGINGDRFLENSAADLTLGQVRFHRRPDDPSSVKRVHSLCIVNLHHLEACFGSFDQLPQADHALYVSTVPYQPFSLTYKASVADDQFAVLHEGPGAASCLWD